jgi:intraflagellar transport protein 140
MAHMCVKTKRLDVAEVCLGNMCHARAAAAVREAKQEPELEAQVAAVAIQLGLLDDAARLYRECGRYDLLNELYRNSGFWERAIAVAETRDRIHLRTTHHLYAQHLEGIGDIKGAIEHYKIAQTHFTQVPRMLFSLGRMDELNDFIHRSQNPQLWKYAARH